MLEERKTLVTRSNSVPELISNLWGEDLPELLSEAEKSRQR